MTAEVKALRQDNTQLRSENRELLASRTQIENNVTTRVKRELLSREKDQATSQRLDSGVLSSLTARVDALSQSYSQINLAPSGSDIPVGLGLDGIGIDPAGNLIWIEPLEHTQDDSPAMNGSGLLHKTGQSTGRMLDTAREQTSNIAKRINTVDPVFTVPRNATLIGSTAMTALVGRVPVQGQVRDPMPFKVITGADNLAANGADDTRCSGHGLEWHRDW